MGEVRIHCYGCDTTVAVDPDNSAEGLSRAGWALVRGETYCPACRSRLSSPEALATSAGLLEPSAASGAQVESRGLASASAAQLPAGPLQPGAGPLPVLAPPGAREGTFAGVSYRVAGELVPQLQVDVGFQSLMFEHHVLLWKDTKLDIQLKSLPGGVKRKIAGLDFFITRTFGSGRIAFSRDAPGQCVALELSAGEAVDVREHQFLAATDNVQYSYERVSGVRNMLLGGSGFFIDKFRADGDALVWLHGNGNVMLVDLQRDEQIDVEPGSWLYKDPTVSLEAVTMGLKTGLASGGGKLTWNRFTGPGRLALQTMFIDPAETRKEGAEQPPATQPGIESVKNTVDLAGAAGSMLGRLVGS